MTESATGDAGTDGGAAAALESMRRHFTEAGLPVPPIPGALAGQLLEQEPWCWTTRPVEPMEMYLFREYPATDLASYQAPYVAVCHAGHGSNSYAITYQLVMGPLAIYTQVAWGGVYGDPERDAAELRDRFDKVARLIELVDSGSADSLAGAPALVVIDSSFRGIGVCGFVLEAFERPEDAAMWMRSLPNNADPLAAAIAQWGSVGTR